MKTIMYFVMLVLLCTSVIGDISISVNDLTLGSSSTERSNPREDLTSRVSGTFSITNNASVNVTGLSVTSTAAAKYNCTLTTSSAIITPNGSVTSTIECTVPSDLDAVDSNSNKIAVSIGSIVVSGTDSASVSSSIPLKMEAENKLEINDVWASINDGSDRKYSDGKKVDNIKPGDSLELRIEARNRFRGRDYDIDIDDVDIALDVPTSDIDLGDSTLSLGTITSDSEEEDSTSIDIDLSISSGSSSDYTLLMEATGTDENGALHGQKRELILRVERENYELAIEDIDFTQNLRCEQDIIIDVRVLNLGRKDHDDFSLEVSSADFDYSHRIENIDLNQDDSDSLDFRIPFPTGFDSGEYSIDIKTYYQGNDLSHDDSILVKIPNCESDDQIIEEVTEPIVVETIPLEIVEEPTILVEEYIETVEEPTSPTYLFLLTGLIGLGLIILTLLVVVIVKKR